MEKRDQLIEQLDRRRAQHPLDALIETTIARDVPSSTANAPPGLRFDDVRLVALR